MFEKAALVFLYTETPLHAGTGAELGPVDLPIQRERVTRYPQVQSSGWKGALRKAIEGRVTDPRDAQKIEAVFGPRRIGGPEEAYGGALAQVDLRLLLFPVRSLVGSFVWVTSPLVLARLKRELAFARPALQSQPTWQAPRLAGDALVSNGDLLVDGRIVLEDLDSPAKADAGLKGLADWLLGCGVFEGNEYDYWREKLPTSLVLLEDGLFRYVVERFTEVTPGIQMEENAKIVKEGPWFEEALPPECLLYTWLLASKPQKTVDEIASADDVLTFVKTHCPRYLQLGGDETTGRGFVKVWWAKEGAGDGGGSQER